MHLRIQPWFQEGRAKNNQTRTSVGENSRDDDEYEEKSGGVNRET